MSVESLTKVGALLVPLVLLLPSEAAALEPLETFLAAAEENGLDAREADAARALARARALVARARLLPVLDASASYLRHSEEVRVTFPEGAVQDDAVITPRDQWQAAVGLSVPLVDVATISRAAEADALADAAGSRAIATRDELRLRVASAYYELCAAESVRVAAERTLGVALEDLAVASSRREAGVATALDVERARAAVERARQTVADADLAVELGRQALQTLTGLPPSAGAGVLPEDDLHEEPALSAFVGGVDALPALRAAGADLRAAESARAAARRAMLPRLSAIGTVGTGNGGGFGSDTAWTAGVELRIALGVADVASALAEQRAVRVASLRAERAARDARDAVRSSWLRVRARIAGAAAARAEARASTLASELARARYESGTGTQLEALQAERESFSAEVARIRADADLAIARLELRVRSGGGR